jgi:hypothetical protein
MNKSKLFHIAHSIKHQFNSFGEALRKAWYVLKLRAKMKSQIVSFRFKKVDGSTREAIGTLRADLLPEIKGNSNKINHSVMAYFDTEANGFRSFKVENLIY